MNDCKINSAPRASWAFAAEGAFNRGALEQMNAAALSGLQAHLAQQSLAPVVPPAAPAAAAPAQAQKPVIVPNTPSLTEQCERSLNQWALADTFDPDAQQHKFRRWALGTPFAGYVLLAAGCTLLYGVSVGMMALLRPGFVVSAENKTRWAALCLWALLVTFVGGCLMMAAHWMEAKSQ